MKANPPGSSISGTLLILLSILLSACSSPVKGLFPPGTDEPSKSIYLVSHGWHAGIVVKREDIPVGIWPQANDFPESEYLEVGWGDREYYMNPDSGIGTALKAGLLPTDSVLHVVGFNGPVTRVFPVSEIIRIDLSEPGLRKLLEYFEMSYAEDTTGETIRLGRSLYGDGQFYLSRETYHTFNTCNTWTARALRSAGAPITPATNLRVNSLMQNAATFGTVIRAAPDG